MENDSNKEVFILDSYGLIYRAYFALAGHPLTNSSGDNISAIVIFFRNLKALLSKYKPACLAAAFDPKGKTFRHELYPEYKATRQKTPEDLHAQVDAIEEILRAFGIPVLRCDGFEADDIIATVAKKCREEKIPCRILSGDKDLLQLVDENCFEMQPDKTNGGWVSMGPGDVTEKWGIGPEKILDYLSLVGDTADNVPGVKGVGDKTALKLLLEYGSLESIYDHASEIKGALGEKIRSDRENAFFSKKLISLRDDVPVSLDFSSFSTENLDYDACARGLEKWGAYMAAKAFASTSGSERKNEAKKEESAPELFDQPAAEEEKPAEIPLVQNKGDYRAVTKLAELEEIIGGILASEKKVVAFDTETTSLDTHSASLVGFSLCTEKGRAVYVPLILSGGLFAPETVAEKDALRCIGKLLSDPEILLVMHNGKFDLEVLRSRGIKERPACRIFDTMVAAWLLDPGAAGKSPFSLEYLAESRLHLKGIEFKDIVQKGMTFADVPLEKAYEYGSEDSDFTFRLYEILSAELDSRGLTELFYGMEMAVLPVLVDMECEGICLDTKALAEYGKELDFLISEKERQIYQIVGHEFNIASPKQLQTVLFEERGLKATKKTKTGYSTDTEVLEELAALDPVPKAILDYRSWTKLSGTYVEALPKLCDASSRIHTSFLQTGTATGRLSSRDPNLQNIPVRTEEGRKIRSAFVSGEGNVLISADYAQIELVVLAHLSGDKNLCDSFIKGTDVHKATASLIYGIPPEEVTPDQRRFAKTVNFGVMYGMSSFRLAGELGISRTEAKNFIDKYFATYSDVRKFLDGIIESTKKNGWVESISGHRRFIPEINSRNKLIAQSAERVAVNTPIQGSAADIVKTAMLRVDAALRKENCPAKMLLQVHDELIFQCPESHASQATEIIRREMEGAVSLKVPLRVSIESGRNWGEFH